MTAKTKIEWADATWNPVTGCTKVSPGCDRCYAERVATSSRFAKSFPNGFQVHMHEDRLQTPARWTTPKTIFVNSMSDLFHRDITDDFLTEVWRTMTELAPQHLYLILTKRAHRMTHTINRLKLPLQPHIRLGFSAEDQRFYDSRLPPVAQLAAIAPAGQIFFVSCEPLLERIDLRLNQPANPPGQPALPNPVGWVIAGGESGPGARPIDPAAFRSLGDQCNAAGVPFFLKQLGGYPSKRGGDLAVLDGRLHHDQPPNPSRPGRLAAIRQKHGTGPLGGAGAGTQQTAQQAAASRTGPNPRPA